MMNTSALFELCHTESVFTLLKSSIPKTYNKHRTIGIKALVTENPFDEKHQQRKRKRHQFVHFISAVKC